MTLLELDVRRGAAASPAPPRAEAAAPRASARRWLVWLVLALVVACAASLFVGAGATDAQMLVISRIPRTVAAVLAGAAMALGGQLMQLLVRNRFVEPSTVGTTESAGAGLLVATLLAPSMPVPGKMLVAVVAALLGTWLFLQVLKRIPVTQGVIAIPLVGIMLSGVISAATTFVAMDFDLLQTLTTWLTGDFSAVMRGRFELLWLVGVLLVITWVAADRFTVAGLGKDHATGLGLNYQAVVTGGLTIVAISSAVCVVVVGQLPFLGLVVPNLVAMVMGDNLRRSLPVVAVSGAFFVVGCDVLARILNAPYELPVGLIVGVLGGAVFLAMLLRGKLR